MECGHGGDRSWCYLCRVESSGGAGSVAWGVDYVPLSEKPPWQLRRWAMPDGQAAYLQFLCREFGLRFVPKLSEGQADLLIENFLDEPMSDSQSKTIEWLGGQRPELKGGPTYGWARAEIRRLVAAKALRYPSWAGLGVTPHPFG
jgi:hypothetical protein